MILFPLIVVNKILSNIIDGFLGLRQTCHYQVFYSLLSFPHTKPLYFFLSGAFHIVRRYFFKFGVPCFTIPSDNTVP